MKRWQKDYPPYEGTEPYLYLAFADGDAKKVWPVMQLLLKRGCRVWYCTGPAGNSTELLRRQKRASEAAWTLLYLTDGLTADKETKSRIMVNQKEGRPITCLDTDGKNRNLAMDLRESTPSISLLRCKTERALEEALIRAEGYTQEIIGAPVKLKNHWLGKLTGLFAFLTAILVGCCLLYFRQGPVYEDTVTFYWDKFHTREIPDEIAKVYGATDVVIRGNFVKDPGGDAITTMYCYRPLVEYNISDGAGRQINKKDYCQSDFGRVAAGVWPWKCKDALFQYNEVYNTRYHNGENQDGQAFDADWGDGTIYQYNYSHDNEGGCFMICLEEAVNTVFRNNISCNDSRAILMPATSPLAKVYNNTFILKEGVPFIATNSGAMGTMELKGNTIVGSGEADWQEDNVTYEGNLFCGFTRIPSPERNVLMGSAPEEDSGK